MIETPNVDWFALSPTLALLAVARSTLLGGVLFPRHAVRAFCVVVSRGRLRDVGGALRIVLFDRSAEPTIADRRVDDARPARRRRRGS